MAQLNNTEGILYGGGRRDTAVLRAAGVNVPLAQNDMLIFDCNEGDCAENNCPRNWQKVQHPEFGSEFSDINTANALCELGNNDHCGMKGQEFCNTVVNKKCAQMRSFECALPSAARECPIKCGPIQRILEFDYEGLITCGGEEDPNNTKCSNLLTEDANKNLIQGKWVCGDRGYCVEGRGAVDFTPPPFDCSTAALNLTDSNVACFEPSSWPCNTCCKGDLNDETTGFGTGQNSGEICWEGQWKGQKEKCCPPKQAPGRDTVRGTSQGSCANPCIDDRQCPRQQPSCSRTGCCV